MNPVTIVYPLKNCLAIVIGGIITGTLQVVLSISYAALIYGGSLEQYLGQGIGFALVGALVTATFITLFATIPGTVGSNQDVSVAIFSIMSISIVASMTHEAMLENTFYTVVFAISFSIILTGLFFLSIGIFRIGGLVRYFPYPVVGGFLAGSGWLLFKGGFSLTAGNLLLKEALQPLQLLTWFPAMCFAVILVITMKKLQSTKVLPLFVVAGIAIFYAAAWQLGISHEELSLGGWLLGPFHHQSLWQPLSLSKLTLVDWGVIAGQTANILTVVAVSSIALLLNASAFELESKQDIDFNKELRIAGLANLLSGCIPGFVGFRQLCLTILNFRMGTQSRIVGLLGAVIILLTIVYGASFISFFPKMVLGGLLMYLGLNFLVEWAFQTWFTLPKLDFAIIWLVLIVIATVGFMPGVAVGLVAAVIMFIVSYSRTDVVRHELTGKSYQSLVPRRHEQRKILDSQGAQLYILQLQGFVFFGTANRLFKQVRDRLCNTTQIQPKYVLLDFQRVKILDSTGMLSFRKLKDITSQMNTHLLLTSSSPEIFKQLSRGGLTATHALTHYFPSLNKGVEWYEEQILMQTGDQCKFQLTLAEQLSYALPKNGHIDLLLKSFERIELEPGATIFKNGTSADHFFFIESGQVAATSTDCNNYFIHNETMKNGQVVGDLSFYIGQNRTTDVIATEPCVLYRLSAEKLQQLENDQPAVASMLHQAMARLLADRVAHLLKTVNALQK